VGLGWGGGWVCEGEDSVGHVGRGGEGAGGGGGAMGHRGGGERADKGGLGSKE